MKQQCALVYYLDHSGFAVKLDENLLIFDYIGQKNGNAGLADGILEKSVWEGVKNTYVFASHNHADHFQPGIFQLENYCKNTVFFLDREISPETKCTCLLVSKGDVLQRDDLLVKVCGSTDIGSSFLVELAGWTLFHAGDLNCWHWEGEADQHYMDRAREDFLRELSFVKSQLQSPLDLAFFPVDDRMGGVYYEGADHLIRQMRPRHFFAMHFWGRYAVQQKLQEQGYQGTEIHRIDKRGEQFVIKKNTHA